MLIMIHFYCKLGKKLEIRRLQQWWQHLIWITTLIIERHMDWIYTSHNLCCTMLNTFYITRRALKCLLTHLCTLAPTSIDNGNRARIFNLSSQLMTMQNIHVNIKKCSSIANSYVKRKIFAIEMICNLYMLPVCQNIE